MMCVAESGTGLPSSKLTAPSLRSSRKGQRFGALENALGLSDLAQTGYAERECRAVLSDAYSDDADIKLALPPPVTVAQPDPGISS